MRKLLRSIYRKLFRNSASMSGVYEEKGYLEAYSKHTDARVAEDPHAAIGGHWEEIGELQFDFLQKEGLREDHTMLDIGCGTLRGGRHFIRFLQPAHYTGIDISSKAIEYANQLVREEGLESKKPRLLVSEKKDLKFTEFPSVTFDFILAQSVFTHLMPEHIEECLAHVAKVMSSSSVFYFTYFRSVEYTQINYKDFSYPITFFGQLAERNGFELRDHSPQYNHPKSQNMLSIRKKA